MTNKKRLGILSIAGAIAVVVATGLLWAQSPGRGDGGFHGGSHGKMLHRALAELDLTDDQKVRVHDVLMASADETDAAREQGRAAREALAEAMHAEVFDEAAIREAYARVATLDADRIVRRAQAFQEIRGILDPVQLETLEEMREEMHERFAEREAGRGHGHRGFHGASSNH